jgi:hypothetical protein
MKTIYVIAAVEGQPVPREDDARRYIESEPFPVPSSSTYYQRRLAHGELKEVSAPKAEKKGA